ncbi:hypothetical protein [Nonomuraea insulae]|uniref:RCK C-terminal domain-containing protein n=1 Tax=Nonomuraea insulae TaxID=1616787 RepID=A0ABW1D5T5_9ACTN
MRARVSVGLREGETVIMIGAYESIGEIGGRLLRALPSLVVLRADQ